MSRLRCRCTQSGAEWESARFGVEESPALAGVNVVAFVELVHQVVTRLAFDLLGAAEKQNCWRAVGFFVDLVNHAMENRLCGYLG